jgi:hypothetical protein
MYFSKIIKKKIKILAFLEVLCYFLSFFIKKIYGEGMIPQSKTGKILVLKEHLQW